MFLFLGGLVFFYFFRPFLFCFVFLVAIDKKVSTQVDFLKTVVLCISFLFLNQLSSGTILLTFKL